MKSQKGFTLIELLVVVTVATFLVSLIMVGFHMFRVKQRDDYRVGVLSEYAKALNVYYDNNGHYPFSTKSPWFASCFVGVAGNWIADNGNYNWSNGYIVAQPHDPLESCLWPFNGSDGTPTATFGYWSDGAHYALVALLEDGSNKNTITHTNALWVDGTTNLYTQSGWYGRTYILTSTKK